MRIGFVLFHWFPHGGLQQDLVKIVRACQGRAEISIHCQRWEGERIEGVQTHVTGETQWSKVAGREAFATYVQQQVKPSVDVLVGFNRLPGLDYYFAADSCFAHQAMQRNFLYRLTPRARQYLRFEQAVFGATSSTVALLLSQRQRAQYQLHYQTPEARLIDLPPGIKREHCAGEDAAMLRESFRREFSISEQSLVVLQVGSSFTTKGVDRSLQALAALPESLKQRVHYFLLGRDKRLEDWKRKAASIGLGSRCHFLDSSQSVRRCMQGADLLLHPSRHESAGMVILEAVVAGLPVLTTSECGYAEHVVRAQAGLVCREPFTQAELNVLLQQMLSADRHQWRTHGIDYGRRHDLYSMPQFVASLLLAPRAN